MMLKCINVNDGSEHFVALLGQGIKTTETRTKRAWKIIQKALDLVPGDCVGIVDRGVLKLIMTYNGVVEYGSLQAFRDDYRNHRVAAGSKYDYVEGKGKVGIMLSDPMGVHIEVPKLDHIQGWRYVEV